MLALEHHICNLLPLLRRRVNPRRVVRTRMQQKHRSRFRTLQRTNEPLDVKGDRLRCKVGILHRCDGHVLKDRMVIGWSKSRSISQLAIQIDPKSASAYPT